MDRILGCGPGPAGLRRLEAAAAASWGNAQAAMTTQTPEDHDPPSPDSRARSRRVSPLSRAVRSPS
jgi:hypothetical protein